MMTPPGAPEASESPECAPASAARRRLLYAGVAGAAALGGLACWRFAPWAGPSGAEQALWGLQFDTPEGRVLVLKSFAGRPLLINFWATWCPPCVQELPMLNAFYREHAAKGWQVLGLAVDRPASVRRFLQHTPLDFPVGLAGLGGADLSRSLGNPGGALPFTVVLDARQGRVRERKSGPLTAQELRQWAA